MTNGARRLVSRALEWGRPDRAPAPFVRMGCQIAGSGRWGWELHESQDYILPFPFGSLCDKLDACTLARKIAPLPDALLHEQ